MKLTSLAIISLAVPFAVVAASSNCQKTSGSGSCRTTTSTNKNGTRIIGGCCRRVWDVSPRPEYNPPDDIATLPEREQRKFVKMFELVPKEVKDKSTQNYPGRMKFMDGTAYSDITNKLARQLARSVPGLAADPAVKAEDVQKMCFDTIVYGRSLIMGRMEPCSLVELAEKYHFKKARKVIEALEDSKNFRSGVAAGYPHHDPECRDFETLAKTVNPASWRAFIERVDTLKAKSVGGAASRQVTRNQLYDRYENPSGRPLPDDLATLPNRERLRLSKAYNLLPTGVLAVSDLDYPRRNAYLASQKYAKEKSNLSMRLTKNMRMLSTDPAVTPVEILKMCDDVVRFGRPLVFGDMRHVALAELASRHRFKAVERFILEVEDGKTSKSGFSAGYPKTNPEFKDFATLAQKACPSRWEAFCSRLDELNKLASRKKAVVSRR